MTDITRLLASLKRRSAHAKEFGDSITFVKLKDIDALVEALEREVAMREQNLAIKLHMSERIAELESRTVTVKLPSERFRYGESDYDDGFVNGWNARMAEDTAALDRVGIKWEAE